MESKILSLVLSICLFGVVVFLGKTYMDALNQKIEISDDRNVQKIEEYDGIDTPYWVGKLKEPQAYTYPASEIELKIDTIEYIEAQKIFKIVIDDLNYEKFTCINQILESSGIKFSFSKTHEIIRLVITADTKDDLDILLKKLKMYGIEHEAKETRKDIE